jgi:hypothetical protein
MNKITWFYRKQIYSKFTQLKNTGSYKENDLSLQVNFPSDYKKLEPVNLQIIDFNCNDDSSTGENNCTCHFIDINLLENIDIKKTR